MKTRTLSLLAALLLSGASSAFAQEELQKAKALYAAAAYEEALVVLTAVPDAERIPQIDQYRAFCLIALGQNEQAQQAIESLLTADPSYVPDPAETSPRVLEAFSAARERVLPGITKQMYLNAKAALDRKDRKAAVAGFQALVDAIDGAGEMAVQFEDLRVLADGFLELSAALPALAEAKSSTPDPAPASAAEPPPTLAVASTTPPVVVKQEFPPWVAYDGVSRRSNFSGILRVRVGANGRVESAELIRRVHPMYDAVLLQATESWIYEPATENGVPVAADVVVQVQLRPPDN